MEEFLPNTLDDDRITVFPINEKSGYLFRGSIELESPDNLAGEGNIQVLVSKMELPKEVKNNDFEERIGLDKIRNGEHICGVCLSAQRGVKDQITIVLFDQICVGFQGPQGGWGSGMEIEDKRFPTIATTCNLTNELIYSVCHKCPLQPN